jgi:hypothetical protein
MDYALYFEQELTINKERPYFRVTSISKLLNIADIQNIIKTYSREEVILIKNIKYLTIYGIYRLLIASKIPSHIAFRQWSIRAIA